MSKYHVEFIKCGNNEWYWAIKYGDKFMAESSPAYSSRSKAKRAFIKITSLETLREIDEGEGW